MKTTHLILPAALLLVGLALPARAETHVNIDLGLRLGPPPPIVVREAPPRRTIVERQYAAPGPGYTWIGGHNTWRGDRWVWVGGTWARPPQSGAYYVEGRWDEHSRNWVESHWEIQPAPLPRVYGSAPTVEYIENAPPPPPREEIIVGRPSPRHVWIAGYWVRHGHRQEWVAGRWELPPHGRREWVAPRWEHRGGSYVFIEGNWR